VFAKPDPEGDGAAKAKPGSFFGLQQGVDEEDDELAGGPVVPNWVPTLRGGHSHGNTAILTLCFTLFQRCFNAVSTLF